MVRMGNVFKQNSSLPNDQFRLGRYLGLSIDIGPALMAKNIKEKGQIPHRSMNQALTQEEWKQEECKNEVSLLMESLHQTLGPCTVLRDLVKLGVEETPQYDPYKDESQNAEKFPMLDEKPKVTPEWGDQYKITEILLPRGCNMSRGQVVCWKHDANGNPIGRSNQNPILE